MKCTLETSVSVELVTVMAEMACYARRPELQALCLAAQSRGRRIDLTAVRAVLRGATDAQVRGLIAACAELGLCDRSGALSAEAEALAERGEFPIPEQGVYRLAIAQSPLLGRRALAFRRVSVRDGRFVSTRPLPFLPERSTPFLSVIEPRVRFELREILPKATPACLPEDGVTLRVRWTIDFDRGENQWALRGALSEECPVHHEPERARVDYDGALAALARVAFAASNETRWVDARRRLAVPFVSLTEDEIESGVRSIALGRVEIPGFGAWESARLEEVPLEPATESDAEKWAVARLGRALRAKPGYWASDRLEALFNDGGWGLAPFTPTLPSVHELLRAFSSDVDVYWGVAAAADLALAS